MNATKKQIDLCREIAKDMIKRDPVKSAWIYWDGWMHDCNLIDKYEKLLKENGIDYE